jgi:hypothetical protein
MRLAANPAVGILIDAALGAAERQLATIANTLIFSRHSCATACRVFVAHYPIAIP